MGFGRLIPPLLMMYLLYFGTGGYLLVRYDIKLSAIAVAVFCLGYYSGAIVMSAFLEAANHLRQTHGSYCLRLTTLGESVEYARWPIKQALINATKMSMIASAIAIPELLSQVNLIMAAKGNLVIMMTTLLVMYYIVTSFWIRFFNFLDSHFFHLGWRNE
jgi:polar amino acid transport system substrate-binding protein